MRHAILAAIGLLAATTATAADRAHPPMPAGNPGEWFGPDAYPPAAIRAGKQGRVVATIAVDATGRPTGCTIAVSSGSADLDGGTCAIATSRMTFTPATDAKGRAIAGDYRLPVRWVLPQPPTTPTATPPVPIRFVGSGDTVTCLVTIDGVERRMTAAACRPLVAEMTAKGMRLDQRDFIDNVTPDELEAAPAR